MAERDDNELYLKLGKILGGQEAARSELSGMREEMREAARKAEDADRRAEQSRSKLHDQVQALTKRVDLVELMAEDTRNRVSLVAPTVQEHEDIKHTASGVTIALKHMGKVIYLTGAAFLAMVGTTIAYIYHLIESGGGMHPR